MKRLYHSVVLTIVILFLLPLNVQAAQLLIPGGQIIGLQLQNGTVTIAAFDDVHGAAARNAGFQIGDEIISVDGMPVVSAEDIRSALDTGNKAAEVVIRRNGTVRTLKAVPINTSAGPRLGIHVKQGITGIGTVTWVDPATGTFGTLGHGVSDARSRLLQLTEGTAYRARVISVKKGLCGEPGLLRGSADGLDVCGRLIRNTPQGVFGKTAVPWQGEALPVSDYQEIHTGKASIRSTVDDRGVQEYSVEILKIYPEDRSNGRNFLIRITDPALLSRTGGIVQGMSGSPIIQDGRLIGAVTHVLVSDPTRGYGIFIENMLEAAG